MTSPLFALDSEIEVLGAVIGGELDRVREVLPDAEVFSHPAHRAIWRAVLALTDERLDPADLALIRPRLEADAEYPDHSDSLSEVVDSFGSLSNLAHHAGVVRDLWERRRLVREAEGLRALAEDLDQPVERTVAELVDRVVSRSPGVSRRVSLASQVQDALEAIEREADLKGLPPGLASGIERLDGMTGGFQRGVFWIVAARPSIGKTAFALHLLRTGIGHGDGCGMIFSQEMTGMQLAKRLVSAEANVNLADLRARGELDRHVGHLAEAAGTISHWDSRLRVDCVTRTPAAIRLAIQRFESETNRPIELVVIDYLTLLQMGGPKPETRTREVGEIARQLVRIAKDLNIPLVCLAQLSRASVKDGKPRRPQLSDLRDSGEIEQHADGVLFLHRIDHGEWDDESMTEILVSKNRDGPTGLCRAHFDRTTGRWSEWKPWATNREVA